MLCSEGQGTSPCGKCQATNCRSGTGPIIQSVALQATGYCIMCGAQLEAEHRFCWSCGAPRWVAESADAEPAAAGSEPAMLPAAPRPQPVNLGVLPWFYAAGALLFLFWATEELAVFASPVGRAQILREIARQGYPADQQPWILAGQGVLVLGALLTVAALHAVAFFGLRNLRRWGWLAAVVIAGFWSLLVVGIPVLRRLLSPPVRQAYGVD
jgi:hypothetical protein